MNLNLEPRQTSNYDFIFSMQPLPKKWRDPITPIAKNWRPKLHDLPKKTKSTPKSGVLFPKNLPDLPKKSKSVHHNGNTVRAMTDETIEKVLDRDDWCCILCKSNQLDSAPHHAYFWLEANRWPDRNEPSQLVILCIDCHYAIHSQGNEEKRKKCKQYLQDRYS